MVAACGPGKADGSGAVKNPKKRAKEDDDHHEIDNLEELMEQDKPK